MNKLKLWFKICRPKTLFASACPVLAGLLSIEIVSRPGTAVCTLLCALSLQILANLVNDFYDYKRGSDKAGRVGPQRALAEGLVSEGQMKRACYIAAALCVILGAVLILKGGWPILLIGVTALIFAWLYTATRHSLSYTGMADIICFLYYGPLAAAGTALLQTGNWDWTSVAAGCVCGCIAVCVLATNNTRDIEDDRTAGKKTFPVRFGMKATRGGVGALLVASVVFAACTFFRISPDFRFGFVIFMALHFGVYSEYLNAQGSQYNKVLFHYGLLNAGYVVLLAVTKLVC